MPQDNLVGWHVEQKRFPVRQHNATSFLDTKYCPTYQVYAGCGINETKRRDEQVQCGPKSVGSLHELFIIPPTCCYKQWTDTVTAFYPALPPIPP